jgi:CRISPR-associated protein Csx10
VTQYRYLIYTLRLNSPAIITIPGGDPNSSSTLSYVPGIALRGAMAKVLGDPDGDNSKKQEFHDLVLGGKVRYLNAYPMVNERRALATPVSLRLKKGDAENTPDKIDLAAKEGFPEEELISLPEEFLDIGAAQPALYNSKISSRIHHQRDREKGRAWKDKNGNTHGAIFTFESLDANQMFGGLIQLRSGQEDEMEQIESRIKTLLGGTLLVGRSRRSGYGGMATITWEGRQNHETVGGGREGLQPLKKNIVPGDEPFRLLLSSPCIVRNPVTGQQDPGALMNRIVSRFDNRVEVIRRVWTFETVGGFNRKWRLELPQTLAVSAGSVFVLKASQAISLNELYEIEHEGLGERKDEGYGRLLFLDKPTETISLPKYAESISCKTCTGQPPEIVTKIESRIVQAQLARIIEEKAAELAKSVRHNLLPTNSLIGRLRTPLRDVPDNAIRILKLWLSDNEAEQLKRPAMDQLTRCKIGDGRDLRTWILDAMNRESILKWLKVDVVVQHHVVSEQSARSGVEAKMEELSVRLIDAVLAVLAVRNKTQEVSDGQ